MMMLNIPIYFDMKFTHHNFYQEDENATNMIHMFFNLDLLLESLLIKFKAHYNYDIHALCLVNYAKFSNVLGVITN